MASFSFALVLFLVSLSVASAQLSSTFYDSSCPRALSTIKSMVNSAVSNEYRMGASLLRLHFHDCFVQLGGPSWSVQLGRRDSTTASFSEANSDLPAPTLDLSELISAFSKKGLTTKEMIVLSGGHTIGQARCTTFRNRIYNETNIDSTFANNTQQNCPSSGGDNNLSPLDVSTNTIFDNYYYKNLLNQKGLLHSDQQLYNGGSADSQVSSYASNMASFFTDFASAMVSMGGISPLTGSSGEIRTNCRKTN
ncbi:Cationic peroxidase 1 [Acorus calamus]|uniref:peroxidase n=1 Tax=Acorus calamus TaxID=4465 RepID=A0AAV9CBI0_ACOCL|nr:Cationic peroxidase 1 [Acorus calamus]